MTEKTKEVIEPSPNPLRLQWSLGALGTIQGAIIAVLSEGHWPSMAFGVLLAICIAGCGHGPPRVQRHASMTIALLIPFGLLKLFFWSDGKAWGLYLVPLLLIGVLASASPQTSFIPQDK